MIPIVFVVLLVSVSVLTAPVTQFRVIKEWNYINYTWVNYETQIRALQGGEYIPQNNLMAGINFYDGFYYLAIPRMKPGVPVTLARINSANPRAAPLLEPYPSWELNEVANCTCLQNVQNVGVDGQGRLWIIDGGKTGTLTRIPNTTCSPKLVIYDIKDSKIILSYTFPSEVANKFTSFLYDLVVDDTDGGYAYITDNSRLDPGLIVYALRQNKSWKIRDARTMRADPLAVEFNINNETIKTPINIAGIALGPKTNINEQNITLNEDRQVLFCPISSFHLYSVSTSLLKDENYSKSEDNNFHQYVRDIGVKASQTDGMKMDNKGILYYGLLSKASIVRWDSSTPFSSGQQTIAKDDNYIQWPNSFTFDDAGNIIVLTNRLEKYIQNKMTLDEPNFRLLMAYVNGKSYVYDDDTLVYSVYETDKQNISGNSTIISHIPIKHEMTPKMQEATTVRNEVQSTQFPGENVSSTPSTSPVTKNNTTLAQNENTSATMKKNEAVTTSKPTEMSTYTANTENKITTKTKHEKSEGGSNTTEATPSSGFIITTSVHLLLCICLQYIFI
ncbi:hypothetical protein Trydic_g9162 [Trypoxylus dichotomus]